MSHVKTGFLAIIARRPVFCSIGNCSANFGDVLDLAGSICNNLHRQQVICLYTMENGKGGNMKERQKFFEEALSDFVHDVASGGAVRHLVDLGYSVEQIMQSLSYPTPRHRVQQTVYRYMLESGLLVRRLPTEVSGMVCAFRTVRISIQDREKIYRYLYEKIKENGEDHCYISCPFGVWQRQNGESREKEKNGDGDWLWKELTCLNKREQDYITGIPWENAVMYHRLNSRMREIGRKLILQPVSGCRFYFLKTGEALEGNL